MARRKRRAAPELEPVAVCPWPPRRLRQTYPLRGEIACLVYVCECGHELPVRAGDDQVDPTRCEHCYWLGKLERWNASIPNPLIRFDD